MLLMKANPAVIRDIWRSASARNPGYTIKRLYSFDFFHYFESCNKYFEKIDAKNLQKGDIITYLPPEGAKYRFGHIGIAAGNVAPAPERITLDFLHAPHKGAPINTVKLTIEDERTLVYENRIIKDRRIIISRLLPQMLLEGR